MFYMEFTFSMARLLFQANFTPLVSLVILVAFIKTNVSFSDNINRLFFLACTAAFLLTVSDNMRFISANMKSPTIYRYISAGVGYALRPTIIYLMTIIASRYKSKINIIFTIPLILCTFLSLISIFPFARGIMFSFSPENKMIRGPLSFLPHIVSSFYAIQIVIYSIKNIAHNKFEPGVVILMEAAAFTAMFLEGKYRFDFILSQLMIFSIIFYYFFLMTQTYKKDSLTHFLNRHGFYLEINHIKKTKAIFLSMDLNNLKYYNDNLGHSAGDKAIVTVTRLMSDFFSGQAKLYRIGGDEFMAIFTKSDFKTVEKLVKKFQEALLKTEYQVACGIAEYNPKDDIRKIITLSDERMYLNKVELKKSK